MVTGTATEVQRNSGHPRRLHLGLRRPHCLTQRLRPLRPQTRPQRTPHRRAAQPLQPPPRLPPPLPHHPPALRRNHRLPHDHQQLPGHRSLTTNRIGCLMDGLTSQGATGAGGQPSPDFHASAASPAGIRGTNGTGDHAPNPRWSGLIRGLWPHPDSAVSRLICGKLFRLGGRR
jgi:hypothetical protein